MRPHTSRSATAPGNLPVSEAPALLLPTATALDGANISLLQRVAPMGMYPLVIPFAKHIMSGCTP